VGKAFPNANKELTDTTSFFSTTKLYKHTTDSATYMEEDFSVLTHEEAFLGVQHLTLTHARETSRDKGINPTVSTMFPIKYQKGWRIFLVLNKLSRMHLPQYYVYT
jgi:hypothetical protein